jgi:hypothetical protein
MRVYVAGPYSPLDRREETRLENIRRASEAAQQLLNAGHIPFCPHTMTAGWEETCGYDDFLRLGIEWLAACDAILLLPGWEQSKGARREHEEAVTLGLLIVDDPSALLGTGPESLVSGGMDHA